MSLAMAWAGAGASSDMTTMLLRPMKGTHGSLFQWSGQVATPRNVWRSRSSPTRFGCRPTVAAGRFPKVRPMRSLRILGACCLPSRTLSLLLQETRLRTDAVVLKFKPLAWVRSPHRGATSARYKTLGRPLRGTSGFASAPMNLQVKLTWRVQLRKCHVLLHGRPAQHLVHSVMLGRHLMSKLANTSCFNVVRSGLRPSW